MHKKRKYDVMRLLPCTAPCVFFFWTHFRLSRWMATHLRMRSTTPSVYFDLEKGVLTLIEQNDCQEDCGCKSYSSGDFKQEGTLAYNYNVHAVNCEQGWKVSGHCSISVVSSKNNFHDNASYSLF